MRGIRPADIDTNWLEDMVKRLFTELTRQLEKIETSAAETPSERAADARSLATLERTLERLMKLEHAHATKHETKVTGETAREKLQRKISRLTPPDDAAETAG